MNLKNEILLLSIISFITIFLWIIFEVNHTRNQSTITKEASLEIQDLNPNLDEELIKNITTQ